MITILVSARSGHGAAHQGRHTRRRDDNSIGEASRAAPINADARHPAATSEAGQRVQRFHALRRAWNRKRGGVNTLEQLHAAISDVPALLKHSAPPSR